MAAFIAKQMIGSKLDSVKEIAGKKEGETAAEEDPEAAAELAEARRLEEERRRAKYAKMENEREKTRVGIREKYNIPKKEEAPVFVMPELSEGTINAKKKSPAELAISTEDDDFDPVKMATNLFGTVKTSLANISFPWSANK